MTLKNRFKHFCAIYVNTNTFNYVKLYIDITIDKYCEHNIYTMSNNMTVIYFYIESEKYNIRVYDER